MARIARVVVPGLPHLITQRGNRGMQVFFNNGDYAAYLELMAEWCREQGVKIWAYCLLPDHVHLIAVPKTADSLARAIGEAHRRYTLRVNSREGWRGYLWQGRFSSFAFDKPHLPDAVQFVEQSPVRGKLVKQPKQWRWSSARAHLSGRDDLLVTVAPLLEKVDDWKALLREDVPDVLLHKYQIHQSAGRPLGSDKLIAKLESKLGRTLKPQKPGPKPKA